MKQYQAYFFDLYGTLVDIHTDENKPSFWKTVARYYSAHGAAYKPVAFRTAYLSLCAEEMARLQSARPGAAVEIDLLRVFRALYHAKGVVPEPDLLDETAFFFRKCATTHLRVYAGARELLQGLRSAGKIVVLLSNAQSCFTRPELDVLSLTDCFDRIFISSEHGFQKPDPRFFSAPLRDLHLKSSDCLMIGNDPDCDLRGAAAVGMDGVYIRSALSPSNAPSVLSDAVLSLPHMDLRRLKALLLSD